ncbi:MAG: N-acetyl-D-Glu racemase DgcA [Pseudomonadota bacterium]
MDFRESKQLISCRVTAESFAIKGSFRIARGAKTSADVITVSLFTAAGERGWAEAVPYARYGETITSVAAQLAPIASQKLTISDVSEICSELPAGAARNALDCALHDLEAKISGERVHSRLGTSTPKALKSAFTLSLDTPEKMGLAAAEASQKHSLLKIKLGGADDIACMNTVRKNAPAAKMIIDANEGWEEDDLADLLSVAADCGAALIEQPLSSNADEVLLELQSPVPICADESAHTTEDLEALIGKYEYVNIKLDKTGGLTEAIKMQTRARELGFGVMVGCMVGTSLAMAPAVLLAQSAHFVDLDGPLLLATDRKQSLTYNGDTVSPPEPDLWG